MSFLPLAAVSLLLLAQAPLLSSAAEARVLSKAVIVPPRSRRHLPLEAVWLALPMGWLAGPESVFRACDNGPPRLRRQSVVKQRLPRRWCVHLRVASLCPAAGAEARAAHQREAGLEAEARLAVLPLSSLLRAQQTAMAKRMAVAHQAVAQFAAVEQRDEEYRRAGEPRAP